MKYLNFLDDHIIDFKFDEYLQKIELFNIRLIYFDIISLFFDFIRDDRSCYIFLSINYLRPTINNVSLDYIWHEGETKKQC